MFVMLQVLNPESARERMYSLGFLFMFLCSSVARMLFLLLRYIILRSCCLVGPDFLVILEKDVIRQITSKAKKGTCKRSKTNYAVVVGQLSLLPYCLLGCKVPPRV